jgi:hypothetical protein
MDQYIADAWLKQHIAAEFVLHLPKLNSIQYRSCTTERNGAGGMI